MEAAVLDAFKEEINANVWSCSAMEMGGGRLLTQREKEEQGLELAGVGSGDIGLQMRPNELNTICGHGIIRISVGAGENKGISNGPHNRGPNLHNPIRINWVHTQPNKDKKGLEKNAERGRETGNRRGENTDRGDDDDRRTTRFRRLFSEEMVKRRRRNFWFMSDTAPETEREEEEDKTEKEKAKAKEYEEEEEEVVEAEEGQQQEDEQEEGGEKAIMRAKLRIRTLTDLDMRSHENWAMRLSVHVVGSDKQGALMLDQHQCWIKSSPEFVELQYEFLGCYSNGVSCASSITWSIGFRQWDPGIGSDPLPSSFTLRTR